MAGFEAVQSYTPGTWFRNLNMSLYKYVDHMSEDCFRMGDSVRSSISTKEEFLKYQQTMKEVFKSSGIFPTIIPFLSMQLLPE